MSFLPLHLLILSSLRPFSMSCLTLPFFFSSCSFPITILLTIHSVVIKTACSASLVALHEACRALQAGDISSAIVGGTSLILAPTLTSNFFGEGILSPGASCKTFDESADGFARAEGITAIYVKRLDDALRDGNPIRAVIRNTGTNSDGKSMGIMSPNAEAHEALMRQVYDQAGLNPRETAFVEVRSDILTANALD
jgi:acyl transferase domain-containing protein